MSFYEKDKNFLVGKATDFFILSEGVLFPFSLSFKNSEKIVFFFPGAFDLSQPKPKFQRKNYFEELESTCVSFFDPSLFLSSNLSLGWFQGECQKNYLQLLLKLVQEIILRLEVENKNILFFSTSGGGLPSLKIAQHFLKSHVYLGNIQTDVLKYYEPSVKKMLLYCYPEVIDITPYKDRLNVFDINGDINIYYAQNTQDKFHYKNHYLPFVKYASNTDLKCEFITYSHISGHNPISKDVEISVINSIFDKKSIMEVFSCYIDD